MARTGSRYKMSFGTGGLMLNESVEVARIHVEGEPWEETIRRALAIGTTMLPKAASNRRTLREVCNRLRTLSEDERVFLINQADRADQQVIQGGVRDRLVLSDCAGSIQDAARCAGGPLNRRHKYRIGWLREGQAARSS